MFRRYLSSNYNNITKVLNNINSKLDSTTRKCIDIKQLHNIDTQMEVYFMLEDIFDECMKDTYKRKLSVEEKYNFLKTNKTEIVNLLKIKQQFINDTTIQKYDTLSVVNINNHTNLENIKKQDEIIKLALKRLITK